MTICSNCGHENADDRDFCERCNSYLRWDDGAEEAETAIRPAVPSEETWDAPPEPEGSPSAAEPPPATPATETTVAAATVIATFRPPAGGGAAGTPSVDVDPGGQATLVALIRNQSDIVDNYDLRVEGFPETWWSVSPSTVYLVPFGAESGDHEKEVLIRIHPPRASEARAGPWPVELVASSRTKTAHVGSARASVVIAAYQQVESRLRPERVRGKRSAGYTVPIRNGGNAELVVALRGDDPEGELSFAFDPPQLRIPPGEEGQSRVKASAARPLTGAERERRPSVVVEAGGLILHSSAVFVQRPLLTRKHLLASRVALTLLAAALLVGGSFLAWTDRRGGLPGACAGADETRCLRYDTFLQEYHDLDTGRITPAAGAIPDTLAPLFNFATSLGVITLVLGVLALLGARSATLTWFAGGLAAVAMVAFFVTTRDTSGTGAWLVMCGGISALAAGLVAAAMRS